MSPTGCKTKNRKVLHPVRFIA
jgi:hypothetical protein